MSGSAAQKLGFHAPVFMHVFDLHVKTPEWKHKKLEEKKIPTFLCLMEVEKHIDKEQIKIAAMETDLANKERDLEVTWLKCHPGNREAIAVQETHVNA